MIVLVPGMLCDASLFSEVVAELPGPVVHAEITAETIGGMAEQVLATVDGEFTLVGLSLGAIVGFEVARRAPERLRTMCVLSSNAGAPRPEQLAAWRQQIAEVRAGGFERIVRAHILPTMFAESTPTTFLRDRFLAMARNVGPRTFQAQLAAQTTRREGYSALSGLARPVQVICGDRDRLCPPEFHQQIAEAAPEGSRVHVLGGAGHLLPLERPGVVGALLRNHLAEYGITGVTS